MIENSHKNTITMASFADIHFGSRDPVTLYNELTVLLEEVKTHKPDFINILGDLFHMKIQLSSEIAILCNKFIDDLYRYSIETGCIIILVRGTLSHDYMQMNSYSHLVGPTFRIYNTTTVDNIKGMKFWVIPEEYEDDKKEYYKDYLSPKEKYDFVLGHGEFSYAGFSDKIKSARKNKIIWDVKDFIENVYGKVLFGHVHTKMRSRNCMYIGSTSRDKFGEEESKGIYIHKYNKKTKKIISEEFIENKLAPLYITKDATDYSEEQEKMFSEIQKDLNKCFKLRIVVNSEISESKYYNLKAIELNYKGRLVVIKKIKGLSKESIKQNEAAEDRRLKRSKLLQKYRNLNFYEVTRLIAKEQHDISISIEEINETLKSSA